MFLHVIALVTSVVVTVVQLPGGAVVQSGAGAAVADLGTVSSNLRTTYSGVDIERRPGSYVVQTVIGLRASSADTQGTVSLQAFLDSEPPGISIRIDGVQLTSFPRTFAFHTSLNVVTRHRLEIEIPDNMDTAQVPSEIPLEFGATAE